MDGAQYSFRSLFSYSLSVFVSLGRIGLSYEKWDLPSWPPLEQRWVGETPFRIEPNQSVTATYTITYNWTFGVTKWVPNGTLLIIQDRRAPANTFEVGEYDLETMPSML